MGNRVLTGPLIDDEGLLVADLDLEDLTRVRYDLDAAGHYARPDIFSLSVEPSTKAAPPAPIPPKGARADEARPVSHFGAGRVRACCEDSV